MSLLHPRTKRVLPEFAKANNHVVIFPAYGTDNRFFAPLNRFLGIHGHKVYDWGLGLNDAGLKRPFMLSEVSDTWVKSTQGKASPITKEEMGVPYLCTRSVARVKSLSETIGEPLALLGWSLGGCIAREVARELPEHVSQVITLGTPTIGGPKYTAAAKSFRKNGLDLDWAEREFALRDRNPIKQAITIINGKYDGVIAKNACVDDISLQPTIIDVNCSHMGLPFHYEVWKIVLQALSKR